MLETIKVGLLINATMSFPMMNQNYVFPSVIMAPELGERHDAKCMKRKMYNSLNLVGVIYLLPLSKRLVNAAVYQDVLHHFLIPYSKDNFEDNELNLPT